jgi:hypothetical protein
MTSMPTSRSSGPHDRRRAALAIEAASEVVPLASFPARYADLPDAVERVRSAVERTAVT